MDLERDDLSGDTLGCVCFIQVEDTQHHLLRRTDRCLQLATCDEKSAESMF